MVTTGTEDRVGRSWCTWNGAWYIVCWGAGTEDASFPCWLKIGMDWVPFLVGIHHSRVSGVLHGRSQILWVSRVRWCGSSTRCSSHLIALCMTHGVGLVSAHLLHHGRSLYVSNNVSICWYIPRGDGITT